MHTDRPRARISARVNGIAESATLAADAKAKALKAEGRPLIGFGARGPDVPTPPAIVEAAQAAAGDPKNERGRAGVGVIASTARAASVARLVCIAAAPRTQQEPGTYHRVLADPMPLDQPIPDRRRPGLYRVPTDLASPD